MPAPSPSQARETILAQCRSLGTETVPLDRAGGRILAAPLRADRDLPPANRSAMDGYAVIAKDLETAPVDLTCTGEVAAGSPRRPRVRPGRCVRILTGANLPPGADTVVMVEMTEEVGAGVVRFKAVAEEGANIFWRGEDAKRGAVLLEKGARLAPASIALAASVGAAQVRVFRRPCIGVLASGTELRSVGDHVKAHEIRNSNSPGTLAALRESGLAEGIDLGRCADDPAAIRRKLRAGLRRCDGLIIIGGMSVGRYDYIPDVLVECGCRMVVRGVAMKPGKPTLFALSPEGKPVFGLPGNPLSAIVAFFEFVLPALRKIAGAAPPHYSTFLVEAAENMRSKGGRTRFAPGRLCDETPATTLKVRAVATRSSADLVAAGRADGVMVLPADQREIPAGTLVEFHPWTLR